MPQETVHQGAVHGATLVTMDETRTIIKKAGILWENDRITMIGPSVEIVQIAEARNIKSQDASGKIVFLVLKERFEKTDQMTKIWLAPAGAWALSLESLKKTSEFAHQADVSIMMHMYETDACHAAGNPA